MEYKELQKLTYSTLGKIAATGLVGLVLTFGSIKISESHKDSVEALGLGLTTVAMYYQALNSRKKYYN